MFSEDQLDLARLVFEPIRRMPVSLLLSLRRLDASQAVISAKQSERTDGGKVVGLEEMQSWVSLA